MNKSGLQPLGRAVLIEPYEPERKKSVIALPDSVVQSGHMLEMRAKVVEVGPAAWFDEPSPRALQGEVVMVAKMSGVLVVGPADGKQYRVINDRDVFVKVTHVEAS